MGAALLGLLGPGPLRGAQGRDGPLEVLVDRAFLGDDFSVTNALVVITTLITLEVGLSLVQIRRKVADRWIDGVPIVVVDHGRLLADRLRKSRIGEGDVLEAARETQGLERLDQIKYAVLERSGKISVIPFSGS